MKNEAGSVIERLINGNRNYDPYASLERNGKHVTPKNPNYLDEDWKTPYEIQQEQEKD